MPLYEFYYPTCQHSFDERRTLSQGTDDVVCPLCAGDKVQRVFTPIMAFSSGSTIGGGGCAGCMPTTIKCAGCTIAHRR